MPSGAYCCICHACGYDNKQLKLPRFACCVSYEEGKNLCREGLLSAARELGLPAEEVEAWLGSPEAAAAVRSDDQEVKSRQALLEALGSCGHAALSGDAWMMVARQVAAAVPTSVHAHPAFHSLLLLMLCAHRCSALQATHPLGAHVSDQLWCQQGGAAGGS